MNICLVGFLCHCLRLVFMMVAEVFVIVMFCVVISDCMMMAMRA